MQHCRFQFSVSVGSARGKHAVLCQCRLPLSTNEAASLYQCSHYTFGFGSSRLPKLFDGKAIIWASIKVHLSYLILVKYIRGRELTGSRAARAVRGFRFSFNQDALCMKMSRFSCESLTCKVRSQHYYTLVISYWFNVGDTEGET